MRFRVFMSLMSGLTLLRFAASAHVDKRVNIEQDQRPPSPMSELGPASIW